MKRTIMVGMVLILMLFLLSSCGVPQEDYDGVSSDLATAQAEIQSLQGDLTAVRGDLTKVQDDLAAAQADLTKAQAQIQSLQSNEEVTEGKRAEALAYAEYLDMALYTVWKESGIAPRFDFEDDLLWLLGLRDRASEIEDENLSNYVEELIEGSEAATNQIWDYCLERIEQALK